ncbi:MAG: DUF308 domain-containing protein [Synergistaceae bacterium]|jgi:uncharacterized membrane protein HdeD (DUF308 family)|nr:DUF308 domain-containing protein [Synergistaceae bacterium]
MLDDGLRKTFRWTLYTDGAIIIVLGVLGALGRMFSAISPPTVMGVGLLAESLNYFVPYMALKNSKFRPVWLAAFGVIDVVFAALFLLRVGLLLFSLPVLIGLWMIFAACLRAYMAYSNRRAGISKWWITAVSCAYMIFASAAMMAGAAQPMSLLSWNALVMTGVFIINEGRKLFG